MRSNHVQVPDTSRRSWPAASFAVLAMVTEVSGCVDPGGRAPPPMATPSGPTVASAPRRSEAFYYCESLCSRLPTCLGYRDPGCTTFCINDAFVTTLADPALTQVGDCYRRAPCQAFVDESVYSMCFESLGSIEPSAQCEEFCVLDTEEAYECGGGYSLAECLGEGVCTWSDSILGQATDCVSLDCEARVMCQNAVFGAGQ